MRTAIFIIVLSCLSQPGLGMATHSASVEIEHGFVLLSASVNGQPGHYILDSGAPGLVVNAKYHETISSDRYILHGVNGSVDMSKLKTWTFQWNSFSIRGNDALAIDLSYLEILLDRNIDGLVGMDIFDGYDVVIDYAHGAMELWNETPISLAQLAWVEFPLIYEDHIPVITLSRGKKQLKFGIDTGAGSNLIDQQVCKSWTSGITYTDQINLIGANQKKVRTQEVMIDGLSKEGILLPATNFVIADLTQITKSTGVNVDGILGQPFFNDRIIHINRDRSTLRISSGQKENATLLVVR